MCSYVAADALVKVGGPGIDALVDALEHPQESVRETAASRLAPLCLPEHEIVLRRALTDQSEYVRANVCAALIRLDPAARDVIAEALRVVKNKDFGPDRFWLLDVAEEVGPRARPLLEAAARSEDAAVREKAVELLRK